MPSQTSSTSRSLAEKSTRSTSSSEPSKHRNARSSKPRTQAKIIEETMVFSYWPVVRSVMLVTLSTLMLVLFVIGVFSQNDGTIQSLPWILYFTLNACVPIIFLVYWASCFPVMILHILSMITAIWSIIYLIIAAQRSSEHIYHKLGQNSIIALASIGFFSSMYHSIMAEHFVKKDDSDTKKSNDDDDNNDSDDDEDDVSSCDDEAPADEISASSYDDYHNEHSCSSYYMESDDEDDERATLDTGSRRKSWDR